MIKKKIVYFSDCTFFAGCENMIPNFLNSLELNDIYDLSFIFRNNKAYRDELSSRLNNNNKTSLIAAKLPAQHIHRKLLKKINKDSSLYKILAAFIIVLWKYMAIVIAIRPLWKILKKEKPDILHINNGGYPAANTSYSVIFAAKLLGVKNIVYVVNNIAQNYRNPIRWIDWFLDIHVNKNVNIFITGSRNAGHKLIEVLKLPLSKTTNIPNGVVPRKITLDKEDYLKSLNINLNGRLLFSTIALLEKRKGHIWLLKAMKFLKESNAILPLLIIEGEGSERKCLEQFILDNDLNNDVKLIGNAPHVFNLLNASDVIVLPSIENEDFPNVIIEAMSMGKPTIGTRIAGIPEQIDDNVNGFIVEPKNEKELAFAIQKLLNFNLGNSFSLKSKEKFNINYTVEISINKYINNYKLIINNKI